MLYVYHYILILVVVLLSLGLCSLSCLHIIWLDAVCISFGILLGLFLVCLLFCIHCYLSIGLLLNINYYC